jgi:hypothetical protein
MRESLALRIGAVFVTLVASCVGIFIPIVLSKWGSRAAVISVRGCQSLPP